MNALSKVSILSAAADIFDATSMSPPSPTVHKWKQNIADMSTDFIWGLCNSDWVVKLQYEVPVGF